MQQFATTKLKTNALLLYYYYIRLMVFFQDNLHKLAQERQTILDFTAAKDGVAVASAGVLDHMEINCTSIQIDNHQ